MRKGSPRLRGLPVELLGGDCATSDGLLIPRSAGDRVDQRRREEVEWRAAFVAVEVRTWSNLQRAAALDWPTGSESAVEHNVAEATAEHGLGGESQQHTPVSLVPVLVTRSNLVDLVLEVPHAVVRALWLLEGASGDVRREVQVLETHDLLVVEHADLEITFHVFG